MNNPLLQRYLKRIKDLEDEEYLFGVISYNIAPTLAGYKPASIITLNNNERNLNILWERYKEDFTKICEINFYEVKKRERSITLLFYNRAQLKDSIFQCENIEFLKKFGYNENSTLEGMLDFLKYRFQKICPHEIGIFLGFPLEDVICFVEYPDMQCLLCGYWKVYNNLKWAEQQFSYYDNAKYIIIKSVLDGIAPSTLIINFRCMESIGG